MRNIAERVGRNEVTSAENTWTLRQVMSIPDMRIEAFSIMMFVVREEGIIMTKNEVKANIAAATGRPLTAREMRRLPGKDEESTFEALFAEDNE